jgi:hypothetical protein
MAKMKVKGHEFNAPLIRDSFDRRALQFHNNIITLLKKIGVIEDDINVFLQPVAYKRGRASVSWYLDGRNLYYSYSQSRKFVENIYVVFKVIEAEVNALLSEEKTFDQFIDDFSEDKDVEEKRIEARKLLGVEEDCNDLGLIGQGYKKMAKKCHPDVSGGSTEKFKEVNNAHKTLKRELT